MLILKKIEEVFQRNNRYHLSLEATETNPKERIALPLLPDEEGRERVLMISASSTQQIREDDTSESRSIARVTFEFYLPFEAVLGSITDLCGLILFINRMTEFPGFEFDQVEGKILYRYVWIFSPSLFDENVLSYILGNIELVNTLFDKLIESVACGKKSFEEILTELIEFDRDSDID